MTVYLNFGSEVQEFTSKAAAKQSFQHQATELARYGQDCTATLHSRDERIHDEPKMCEYPDAVLSLTSRGALKVETC